MGTVNMTDTGFRRQEKSDDNDRLETDPSPLKSTETLPSQSTVSNHCK